MFYIILFIFNAKENLIQFSEKNSCSYIVHMYRFFSEELSRFDWFFSHDILYIELRQINKVNTLSSKKSQTSILYFSSQIFV